MIVYIDGCWSAKGQAMNSTLTERMTALRHIGLVAIAAVLTAACATRRPEIQIPEAPHSIVPVWRLETGDLITTKIYREPDLSSQTVVSQSGEGYFPGIGRVKVAGITL